MVRQGEKVKFKGMLWKIDSPVFVNRGNRSVIIVKGKKAFMVQVKQLRK
jgi:hypothetical protein